MNGQLARYSVRYRPICRPKLPRRFCRAARRVDPAPRRSSRADKRRAASFDYAACRVSKRMADWGVHRKLMRAVLVGVTVVGRLSAREGGRAGGGGATRMSILWLEIRWTYTNFAVHIFTLCLFVCFLLFSF